VAKKWLVYPFTKKAEGGGALQRDFQVDDPDDPGRFVRTIRVSQRDGKRAYKHMLTPGIPAPFEWEFEDAVEVIAKHKLPRRRNVKLSARSRRLGRAE